jgi:hypothetical protein
MPGTAVCAGALLAVPFLGMSFGRAFQIFGQRFGN